MLYICYAENAGYYLINEMGFIHCARWFSTQNAAENYCLMHDYNYDYNYEIEAA